MGRPFRVRIRGPDSEIARDFPPEQTVWVEVKGVNLERDNTALFPDAPSARAVKHVEELMEAKKEGYGAVLLFVVQMEGIRRFAPNEETQPEFAEALLRAKRAGVRILAMGCTVEKDGMRISYGIPVILPGEKAEKGSVSDIASYLLPWYDEHKRQLPWRQDPAPYRVWVSEIMLQQTRVEAVKPYFERFMKELPDIEALAAVPQERLLKLWEGLGYYSRARNLQKAACEIMERFSGRMPEDVEELLTLPGIGPYTAGASSSIACGRPVPAVDGNVLRVLARLRMDGRDMTNQTVKKSVEEELSALIPRKRPGDFNQAMMDIGATVCLPNGAPRCGFCPLAGICMAHAEGREQDFPKKAPKKERTVEEKTVFVLLDEKKAAFPETSRGRSAGRHVRAPFRRGKKEAGGSPVLSEGKGTASHPHPKAPCGQTYFYP